MHQKIRKELQSLLRATNQLNDASVVELVDTLDSKSGFFGSGGSSPPTGTILCELTKPTFVGFFVPEG